LRAAAMTMTTSRQRAGQEARRPEAREGLARPGELGRREELAQPGALGRLEGLARPGVPAPLAARRGLRGPPGKRAQRVRLVRLARLARLARLVRLGVRAQGARLGVRAQAARRAFLLPLRRDPHRRMLRQRVPR